MLLKYTFNPNENFLNHVCNCSTAAGIARRLYDFLDNFYDAGINYETIAHRNFRCIAVLVTTKDQLPRLEANIETYSQAHRENASKIEIKCFAEEAL